MKLKKFVTFGIVCSSFVLSSAFAQTHSTTTTTTHNPSTTHTTPSIHHDNKETVGEFVSDSTLTGKIKAAFITEKGLKSTGITVTTKNDGVVHLTGHVENEAQKTLAEKTTKEVSGVKSVVNSLTVTPNKTH